MQGFRCFYAVTPVVSFLLSAAIILGSVGTVVVFSQSYLNSESSKVALSEVKSQLEYLSTTFDELSKSNAGDNSEVPISISKGDMSMDCSYSNTYEKPIEDFSEYNPDSLDNNRNVFYYTTREGFNFSVSGLDDSDNVFSVDMSEGVLSNATAYWLMDNSAPEIDGCSGDVLVGTGDQRLLWVEASDNTGIEEAVIIINSTVFDMEYNEHTGRWQYLYTAPSDNLSIHSYQVKVYDIANAYDSTPLYDIKVFDNDPPVITGCNENELVSPDDSVCLWATATDNIGVVTARIAIEGDSTVYLFFNESSSRWEGIYSAGSEEDIFLYTLYVYDAAGNSDSSGPWELIVGFSSTVYSGNITLTFSDYENMTCRDSTVPNTILWAYPDNVLDVHHAVLEFKHGLRDSIRLSRPTGGGGGPVASMIHCSWHLDYENPPHTNPVANIDFSNISIDGDGCGNVSINVLDNDVDYDPYDSINPSNFDLSDVCIVEPPLHGDAYVGLIGSKEDEDLCLVINYTADNWNCMFGSGCNVNFDYFNYTVNDSWGCPSNEATVYIYREGSFDDLADFVPFSIYLDEEDFGGEIPKGGGSGGSRDPNGERDSENPVLCPVDAVDDFIFLNNSNLAFVFSGMVGDIVENDIPSQKGGSINRATLYFEPRTENSVGMGGSESCGFPQNFGNDIFTYCAQDNLNLVSLPGGVLLGGDEEYRITLYDEYDNVLDNSTWYTIHYNRPPVADAGGPYEKKVDHMATFDASGSFDPDGSIESYTWWFGDGTSDDGMVVNHSYSEVGNYSVTLKVVDNDGCNDFDYTYIDVIPDSSGGGGGSVSWVTGCSSKILCEEGSSSWCTYTVTVPPNHEIARFAHSFTYEWKVYFDGNTYYYGTNGPTDELTDSQNINFYYENGEGRRIISCTITNNYGYSIEQTKGCSVSLGLTVEINGLDSLRVGWFFPGYGNTFYKADYSYDAPTTLEACVSCGVPPYQYEWDNGVTTSSRQINPNTGADNDQLPQYKTYSVTVTDSTGTPETAEITVALVESTFQNSFTIAKFTGSPDDIYLYEGGYTSSQCFGLEGNNEDIITYTDEEGNTQTWEPSDLFVQYHGWSGYPEVFDCDESIGCGSLKWGWSSAYCWWDAGLEEGDTVTAVLSIDVNIRKYGPFNSPTTIPVAASKTVTCWYFCFLEDTKVAMIDGSYNNIENLNINDQVLSYDFINKTIINGSIEHVFHFDKSEMGSNYYIIINKDLKVTPDHRFYSNNDWIKACDLKVGDILFSKDSEGVLITSIEKIYNKEPVFDLDVEPFDNYFVNINGEDVLVHNTEYFNESAPPDTYHTEDLTKNGNSFNSTAAWPLTGAVCIYLKDDFGLFGKIWIFDYDRPEFCLSDSTKMVTIINNIVCNLGFDSDFARQISKNIFESDNALSIRYIQTKCSDFDSVFSGNIDFKIKSSMLYKNTREKDRSIYNFNWILYDEDRLKDLIYDYYINQYNFKSLSDRIFYIGSDEGLKLSFSHSVLISDFDY